VPKLRNPNFVAAEATAANKTAIQNVLAALPANKDAITFDEIRAAVPALSSKADGVIAEIARSLGLEVVP
jgi:hypothetical protein